MAWGGVGPHGRGPLGAQRDPMGGDPWEGEPLGAQRDPVGGVSDPPMGGEPLGAQGIPWEGTLGAPIGNHFERIYWYGPVAPFYKFRRSQSRFPDPLGQKR